MGKQVVPPNVVGKFLLMGQCVREFRDKGQFVDGCPPHGGWILTERICGIDKKAVISAIERIHQNLDEIAEHWPLRWICSFALSRMGPQRSIDNLSLFLSDSY